MESFMKNPTKQQIEEASALKMDIAALAKWPRDYENNEEDYSFDWYVEDDLPDYVVPVNPLDPCLFAEFVSVLPDVAVIFIHESLRNNLPDGVALLRWLHGPAGYLAFYREAVRLSKESTPPTGSKTA